MLRVIEMDQDTHIKRNTKNEIKTLMSPAAAQNFIIHEVIEQTQGSSYIDENGLGRPSSAKLIL